MRWVRWILLLCVLGGPVCVLGQGLVLLPFDAPGCPDAEVSFYQETLSGQLSPGIRLFEGAGVEAALALCGGEAPSITACLALVGETFEAGLGARGRWVETGEGDAFFLEMTDLVTGEVLFSGRDIDGELPAEARLAALARRARARAGLSGTPEASLRVLPGMEFVRISDEGEAPLYLQASEVTQAQWCVLMGYNPSWFIDCGDTCPVENVTREEIDRFLTRLNIICRGRLRLPTLEEWQKAQALSDSEEACLAGNSCVSYGGYPCDAWVDGNPSCTHCGPRAYDGGKGRLVNMAGNVWEWLDAPEGSAASPGLLVGGGWSDSPFLPGSVVRSVASRRFAADDVGFRLLLEGESKQPLDTH